MTSNGVHILYRAYFHVFSELMLTEAVDLTVAFHSVIPTLLVKVSIIILVIIIYYINYYIGNSFIYFYLIL